MVKIIHAAVIHSIRKGIEHIPKVTTTKYHEDSHSQINVTLDLSSKISSLHIANIYYDDGNIRYDGIRNTAMTYTNINDPQFINHIKQEIIKDIKEHYNIFDAYIQHFTDHKKIK